jgi:hypothetical protein
MLMPDSGTLAEPADGGAEFPGRRPRRDMIWFVPTVVAGAGVAIPAVLTMLIAGVLYTFGMDSCGPGSGSGKPCPDPVKAPLPALWSAALALCLLTLVLPRQTRFRVPRWLLAAGAVALAWLGLGAVGGQWPG